MSDTFRNNPAMIPKAWPFEEAQKVARRVTASGKGHALFETGYGPSGLPHIGTFGEVARTTWVRNAFAEITGLPSKLRRRFCSVRRVPSLTDFRPPMD